MTQAENPQKSTQKGPIGAIFREFCERWDKDRLLRFGSELVLSLCEHFGVEVIIINASEDSTFEEDLTNDVIEIVTVFSGWLYGSHNHKNKKVMERLQEVAKEVTP
ncbi:unnamed protein product [Acidithrix sp. C25]|nr:unnamed protein product [Acidithrix sp. C25]